MRIARFVLDQAAMNGHANGNGYVNGNGYHAPISSADAPDAPMHEPSQTPATPIYDRSADSSLPE